MLGRYWDEATAYGEAPVQLFAMFYPSVLHLTIFERF